MKKKPNYQTFIKEVKKSNREGKRLTLHTYKIH